jgi:hypothetical protein
MSNKTRKDANGIAKSIEASTSKGTRVLPRSRRSRRTKRGANEQQN